MRARRWIGLAGSLGLVLAAVGAARSAWQRRRGAQLNAAFHRALENHDLREMERLVARGAKPTNPAEGETALIIAASGGHPALARGLLEAGAEIRNAGPPPPGEGDTVEDHLLYEPADTARTLAEAARKPWPVLGGYVALGRLQMRRERYALATEAFATARRMAHSRADVERSYQEARERAEVAHDLSRQVTEGRSLIAVRPLPVAADPGLWVALEARVDSTSDEPYHGIRVLLGRQQLRGCRIVWHSATLENPRGPKRGEVGVGFRVEDRAGDGDPRILVSARLSGLGWSPSRVLCYRPAFNRLVLEHTLTSTEEVELTSFGPAGKQQIRTTREIGWGANHAEMAHAEQFRWGSLYGWENGRFGPVDPLYPESFREYPGPLRALLRDHPGDPELLAYLGYAEQLTGHPGEARRDYSAAERAIRKAVRAEREPELKRELERMLRQTRDRLARVANPGQPVNGAGSGAGPRSTPRG